MKMILIGATALLLSVSAFADRRILGRVDLGNNVHVKTIDVRQCGIVAVDFKIDQGDAAQVEWVKILVVEADDITIEVNEKLEPEDRSRRHTLTTDRKGVCIDKIKVKGESVGPARPWSTVSEIEFRGHEVF